MPADAQSLSVAKPPSTIRVSERDTVAITLRAIVAGEALRVDGETIIANSDIPAFHKIAIFDHAANAPILRFGEVFAQATGPIARGDHVHTHNAATTLSGNGTYAYTPADLTLAPKPGHPRSFMGYRRPAGRVGTRNEVWIIPTVGCVAHVCEQIARRADSRRRGSVDAVVAFPHVFGCSQLGDDLDATRRLLSALVQHPNAGGVLLVGLGCENNQASTLLGDVSDIAEGRLRTVIAQEALDELEEGLAAVDDLIAHAADDQRSPCQMADLVIGLKCGGSDALSGLTANPLLGDIADHVTAAGGSALLTEIPEIFGAEHLLMRRAASEAVFDAIGTLVNDFKQYFTDHGQTVHENPSPGNKAGGITTLEEKSLGAVQKAGQAIVTDVLGYADRVRKPGLSLLEAPGNDAVSSTALAAAGATLILFTTGRGTPLGFPVPTVKISSNSDLAKRKPGWIDFDAGQILSVGERAPVYEAFLDTLVDIASGRQTCNERNGERAIAIWKRGVTL